MGLLPQPLREELRDAWNARGAADQEDAIELARANVRIGQGGGDRPHGPGEHLFQVALELVAGDLAREVPGLTVHRGDVVLLHQGVGLAGELDLGALRRPPQPGLQEAVFASLLAETRLRLQPGVEPLQDQRIEVFTAEPAVSGGRQHLDHAILDTHHRHVEGPPAQVVDEDPAPPLVASSLVAEGGGGRLVDDPHDVEAGDLARLARRLPLGIGEVGRHGDHRPVHLPSQRPAPPAP